MITWLDRKFVVSAATLTPGMALIYMQEYTFFLIVLIGVAAATAIILVRKSRARQKGPGPAGTEYQSSLKPAALRALRTDGPDPGRARAELGQLMSRAHGAMGFVTSDDQVAMVLSQVLAQWDATDLKKLSDDQIRELWLVEKLIRSSPAEAGKLADHFTAPDVILAMRDRVALHEMA